MRKKLTLPVGPKFLFLLDYDGTLTDFKKNPEHSHLTPAARTLLKRLCRKHPVILVSGRNIHSLETVSGLIGFPMVGTHGFEAKNLPGGLQFSSRTLQQRFKREALSLWENLQALALSFPGIHIEKKPYSSTLHYRGLPFSAGQVRDLHRRFKTIFRKSVTPRLWTLQGGKMMIEAKPKGFSKGKAVLKLMKKFPGYFPIYAGDDLTDLSVFQALGGKGLKIAVGHRLPKSATDWRFDSPKDFLKWLAVF